MRLRSSTSPWLMTDSSSSESEVALNEGKRARSDDEAMKEADDMRSSVSASDASGAGGSFAEGGDSGARTMCGSWESAE